LPLLGRGSVGLNDEYQEHINKINEIGYGMLAEQIFLYKNGYGEFLREFGKVFGEWSNY
jgi:hypothetical protein